MPIKSHLQSENHRSTKCIHLHRPTETRAFPNQMEMGRVTSKSRNWRGRFISKAAAWKAMTRRIGCRRSRYCATARTGNQSPRVRALLASQRLAPTVIPVNILDRNDPFPSRNRRKRDNPEIATRAMRSRDWPLVTVSSTPRTDDLRSVQHCRKWTR